MKLFPERWTRLHAAAVLALAVLAVYGPSLPYGWVGFDDGMALSTERVGPSGPGGFSLWAEFALQKPLRAPFEFVAGRQLTNATMAADLELFGEDAWPRRLENVLWHLASALAAAAIAAALLGSPGWGLFTGLLFALHPLQTESVVYLAGRRDVLSGALGLAGMALWIRAPGRRGAWAAAALWILALAAKNSAVAWPLIALAHDRLLLRTDRAPSRPVIAAALGAACALVLYQLWWEHGENSSLGLGPGDRWYGGSLGAQWATEPRIVLMALRLIVWPFPQSADYSWKAIEPSTSFLDPWTVTALTALAALAFASAAAARKDRVLAFALAALGLSYLPMVHVVATTHNLEPFAEHWLYLPLFGAALAAARLLQTRVSPRPAAAAAAVLILGLGAASIARARVWRDDLTFWTEAARSQPRSARAQGGLGLVLQGRGRLDRAEALFRRAIELRPDDPRSYTNLASVLLTERRLDEARRVLVAAKASPLGRVAFRDAIDYGLAQIELAEDRPWDAFRLLSRARITSAAQNERGRVLSILGNWSRAAMSFQNACRTNPGAALAHNNLGAALLQLRRPAEAVAPLERAAALSPGNPDVEYNLGRAYAALKRNAEARLWLSEVQRRRPGWVPALLARSELERRSGLKRAAVSFARRAVELDGSAPAYRQLSRALGG